PTSPTSAGSPWAGQGQAGACTSPSSCGAWTPALSALLRRSTRAGGTSVRLWRRCEAHGTSHSVVGGRHPAATGAREGGGVMMEQYRQRGFGSVAALFVASLAGASFATNASLFADDTARTRGDLVGLGRVGTARLEENAAEVAELRRRRDELVAARQPMP